MSDRRSVEQVLPALPAGFANVDLGAQQLARFDLAIRQRGQRALYGRATSCPCVTPMRDDGEGSSEINCPSCGGLGRLWDAALEAETRVLVTALDRRKRLSRAPGELELGRFNCTFQSAEAPDYFDRIKLVDAPMPVTEVRVRPAAGPETLTTRSELVEVTSVHARDPAARTAALLVEGTDYSVNPVTNTVTLLGTAGTFPGQEARFSLRYQGYPW